MSIVNLIPGYRSLVYGQRPPQAATPESFFASGVHAVYDAGNLNSLTFSGPDVVAAENTVNPGTRDLDLSAAPPEYAAAGLDGQPTLRFRDSEYGISTGWTISGGDRPSVHAVIQAAVVERKSWFCLRDSTATFRHWGYLETSDNTWRQLTVASTGYGGAGVADTPGLHTSGFPVSGHYARLNLGTKATGGTAGIGGAVADCIVGSRNDDGNSLNYLDCDVSLFVVAVDSVDAEAEAFANDFVAPRYPTIAGALP